MRYEIKFDYESDELMIVKTKRKTDTFRKSRVAKKYLNHLRKNIEALESIQDLTLNDEELLDYLLK